jgi:hypothetical protein
MDAIPIFLFHDVPSADRFGRNACQLPISIRRQLQRLPARLNGFFLQTEVQSGDENRSKASFATQADFGDLTMAPSGT